MINIQLKKQLRAFQIDVHIVAKTDDIIILFGPSGSGKTTCLDMIAGVMEPDEGIIQIGEHLFFTKNKQSCPPNRRKIGYVMQEDTLFPHMTALKNIQYGMDNGDKNRHALTYLKQLGVSYLRNVYPYDMSGGERRRIAIARALAIRPRLLLLDEPMKGLDQAAKEKTLAYLINVKKELHIPIIMVTHHLNEMNGINAKIYPINNGQFASSSRIGRRNDNEMEDGSEIFPANEL